MIQMPKKIDPPRNNWLADFKVKEPEVFAPEPLPKNYVDKHGVVHYNYNPNLSPERNQEKRDRMIANSLRKLGQKGL